MEEKNDAVEKNLFEKTVIIKSSGEIVYEIFFKNSEYSRNATTTLENFKLLPTILKKFKDFRICKGVSDRIPVLSHSSILKTCTGTDFRHTDCFLLSFNSERCQKCKVYCKSLKRSLKKAKLQNFAQCVSQMKSKTLAEQIKLKAMQQKLKVAAKKSRRLKHELFLLKNSIAEQQQKVAHLSDDCLDKISKNEKLVVQEIISADRKNDPRGRRYTDDFIMLYMLMNIRSTSYYEFLRANNIIFGVMCDF